MPLKAAGEQMASPASCSCSLKKPHSFSQRPPRLIQWHPQLPPSGPRAHSASSATCHSLLSLQGSRGNRRRWPPSRAAEMPNERRPPAANGSIRQLRAPATGCCTLEPHGRGSASSCHLATPWQTTRQLASIPPHARPASSQWKSPAAPCPPAPRPLHSPCMGPRRAGTCSLGPWGRGLSSRGGSHGAHGLGHMGPLGPMGPSPMGPSPMGPSLPCPKKGQSPPHPGPWGPWGPCGKGMGSRHGLLRSPLPEPLTAAGAGGVAGAAGVVAPLPAGAVLAILCCCAAAAQVLESRTEAGARISAPVLAMALACILGSAGVLPLALSRHAAAYDVIWEHIMPLAVSFSLLESDVSQVLRLAGPSLGAFLLGSLCTAVGTVAAFVLVGKWMGSQGWKVAACFCSSYIGGSLNFAATAQGLGLGSDAPGRALLAAGMSVDNLLMALFFAVLGALPGQWGSFKRAKGPLAVGPQGNGDITSDSAELANGPKNKVEDEEVEEANGGGLSMPGTAYDSTSIVTVETLSLSIAAATSALALSSWLCARQAQTAGGTAKPQVAVIALLSSLIGALLPKLASPLRALQLRLRALVYPGQALSPSLEAPLPALPSLKPKRITFAGSALLSSALLHIFFATIGATANIGDAVCAGGPLFAFVALLLLVHLTLLLALGKLFKIPLDILIIAANANVGGPATAAAMATARGWHHLVQPAIVTGTLGYTIGTPIAFFVASKVLKPLAMSLAA